MNEGRKARIAELEKEAKRLRDEEDEEQRTNLKKGVDALFAGLAYKDACVVRSLVEDHCRKLYAQENDDDYSE